MKTKFITILLLITTIFGCKDEKSVDNLEIVKPDVIDNSFKVTLDVIVKENDDFSLFYTEDGSTDFTKIEPIWISVKGSESSQKVIYSLPEDVIPTQLRLDFGINKNQKDIVLNNVSMNYKGKTKTIGCPNLVSFFRADDSKCTFDHVTGKIVAKIVDGKIQYPSLYPHETVLQPEIEKLIKQ
jgi:hypothetical protein